MSFIFKAESHRQVLLGNPCGMGPLRRAKEGVPRPSLSSGHINHMRGGRSPRLHFFLVFYFLIFFFFKKKKRTFHFLTAKFALGLPYLTRAGPIPARQTRAGRGGKLK